MTKKLKLIREAFDRLHVLNNIDWKSHREALHELTVAEEKGHRGWGPDFAKHHPIRKAWRGLDVKEIAALDYCEFVRVAA